MRLEFYAQEVDYVEAIDGEIVQVSFQEKPDPGVDYGKKNSGLPPPIKCIDISVSYEFPPYTPTVHWCDGEDFGGGQSIKNLELSETRLKISLEKDIHVNVEFNTDEATFKDIKRFLTDVTK